MTINIDILLYISDPLGRRQVVRQLVLVQPSQRFESFRPRILKKSSLELFFNVLLGAMDESQGSNRARDGCILLSVLVCTGSVKILGKVRTVASFRGRK